MNTDPYRTMAEREMEPVIAVPLHKRWYIRWPLTVCVTPALLALAACAIWLLFPGLTHLGYWLNEKFVHIYPDDPRHICFVEYMTWWVEGFAAVLVSIGALRIAGWLIEKMD